MICPSVCSHNAVHLPCSEPGLCLLIKACVRVNGEERAGDKGVTGGSDQLPAGTPAAAGAPRGGSPRPDRRCRSPPRPGRGTSGGTPAALPRRIPSTGWGHLSLSVPVPPTLPSPQGLPSRWQGRLPLYVLRGPGRDEWGTGSPLPCTSLRRRRRLASAAERRQEQEERQTFPSHGSRAAELLARPAPVQPGEWATAARERRGDPRCPGQGAGHTPACPPTPSPPRRSPPRRSGPRLRAQARRESGRWAPRGSKAGSDGRRKGTEAAAGSPRRLPRPGPLRERPGSAGRVTARLLLAAGRTRRRARRAARALPNGRGTRRNGRSPWGRGAARHRHPALATGRAAGGSGNNAEPAWKSPDNLKMKHLSPYPRERKIPVLWRKIIIIK